MKLDRGPTVSVIVTVFNGQALAKRAIESVLAQTLADLEVIVIDDGSTDATLDTLRQLGDRRVRLVANRAHGGRTRCLNQGVGLATGEFVAILDADDVSFPERLARQCDALSVDPGLDLVGSRILRIDTEGRVLGVGPDALDHGALEQMAWRSIPIPHPTWCGRRRWFELHPYRQWLRCSEDQELLYRAFPTSRFACLDDVLVVKRERELRLSTILRRRVWQTASEMASDMSAGRLRRAGSLALRTAVAATRFVASGGWYEPTWRWSPADEDVVDRYERLRLAHLGSEAA